MAPGTLVLFRILLEEVIDQQRNVLAPLAQWRQVDGDHVETVKQIFAEPAVANHLAQINIGGGDDAHVHLHLLRAAQMHKPAILKNAQDLALRVHGHGADFVEEERTAIRDFE